MLRRLLGENIETIFTASSAPAWVRADTGMLEQVVMNLCINARDAMPKGGRLRLETGLVEFGHADANGHTDARPGRFVCLVITDTGCGMEESVLRRIFEPFFTTKEAGKGTGLGLATVYGIVKQHEGWVEVESAAGRGSSFRIYLPAAVPAAKVAGGSGRPEEIAGGSESVLLVEDEASVRRTTALCLRKLGYAVLEACNGEEALKLWGPHQQRIGLLFTDMLMPGKVTGLDLAQLMLAEKKSLGVIISSGYSAELAKTPPLARPNFLYLPKPFSAATMARMVRSCLDSVYKT
jgi:CheY-like chemotaxis protein